MKLNNFFLKILGDAVYKISIIIPVYNAEKTLKRAINSVINQTLGFENIELIIVDDNSNDSSKQIISYYNGLYDNVIGVFLDENHGGPAIPRNIAMNYATADYLIFLDNDDALIKDYCETLYNCIVENNCDVVACRHSSKFLDGIYAPSNFSKEYVEVEDRFSIGFAMWANIFKTSFVKEHEIICPNTGSEDGNFTIRAYNEANKVMLFPNYFGYIHTVESNDENSLGHSHSLKSFDRSIEGYTLIKDYIEENHLNGFIFNTQVRNLLFALFDFNCSNEERNLILEKIYFFEKGLNYTIKLDLLPLKIINNFILDKKFFAAGILISLGNKLYKQRKIKNFIYKKAFGLKKLDVDVV